MKQKTDKKLLEDINMVLDVYMVRLFSYTQLRIISFKSTILDIFIFSKGQVGLMLFGRKLNKDTKYEKGEKMKMRYLILIAFVFMVVSLGCIGEEKKQPNPTPTQTTPIQKEETNVKEKSVAYDPPQSLDKYYEKEPLFLFKMFELGGAMMGIVANFRQNDTNNTKTSFDLFSKLYEEDSNLVSEWKSYYNIDAVNKLGNAIDSGSPGEIFTALDEIGKTCGNCHRIEKPAVWAKYHWKDFRKITMSTGNPQEPELPFILSKMKYMAPAFDGTMVNLKENQKKDASDSWNQFNTIFSDLEKTCLQCHTEPPRYFVSQDIKSLISKAGQQIVTGDLASADKTMQQIGVESCYKCHIIHEPAQRIKEALENGSP